jgi:hypothetical protein
MEDVTQIERLGWEWLPDFQGNGPGVILRVQTKGNRQRAVFVPLQRVWVTFDRELARVGCPISDMGEPFSIGGFFSAISNAVKSVGRGIAKSAKKLVPKAVQRAAARVVKTAKSAVRTIGKGAAALGRGITKIPVLGTIVKAGTSLALLPARAASQLLQGKRIDRIAMDQLRGAVSGVKTLAPYVQTVISFVPGVGQGLSAGIGAGLALAQGQSITEAMLAAAKGALPGGPAAQAVFAVASGIAQGKRVDQIALNALPIPAAQKQMLVQGISAAKALADGKSVQQVAIDAAMRQLPPAMQKAAQVGLALGQAKSLQGAIKTAATSAVSLTADHAAGMAAAKAVALGRSSPAAVAAMRRAVASKSQMTNIVRNAAGGSAQAQRVVHAMGVLNAKRANAARAAVMRPVVRPLPSNVRRTLQRGMFA